MVDSGNGKMKMDVESDRLSSLPDDLIHKILSFVEIREAIGAGVLSSRWRFIWTSLPYLSLSCYDFPTQPKFSKFVTNVLSHRNNQAEVYSMKLKIRVKESLLFLKRILKYAFSHNIQHLDVVFLLEKASDSLLSLFSSQPLKHLSLTMQFDRVHTSGVNTSFASTPGLSTLTTLDLRYVNPDNVENCITFFSKCANLKNLTLYRFNPLKSNSLSICHPQLSNLTLEFIDFGGVVTIDAPKLKNLTIRFCKAQFVISTPVLASLLYRDSSPFSLSTDGFHSLEKADIYIPFTQDADIDGIACLLKQLHNVKFLTLNMGIIEILSSSMDLISKEPSPFVNLKSLKICTEIVHRLEQALKEDIIVPSEVKTYLLGGSPGSTLTMFIHEEVRAQKLMAELRVCLDEEKENYETYRMERGKTLVESHGPKKVESWERMPQIRSGWVDLVQQLQRRKENGRLIMSKLQSIEDLLTKLPPSNRAKIQPCVSSLSTEVDIAISMITDFMKILCAEKSKMFKSRLS